MTIRIVPSFVHFIDFGSLKASFERYQVLFGLQSAKSEGVLPNKEVGGLDLTSSLEAKSGARSGQGHQIRGKIRQKLGKSPNFGVTSEFQRAKFGVFVTYIFGGKIWGSNKYFRGKFWGQAPRPPNMEVPPGCEMYWKHSQYVIQ